MCGKEIVDQCDLEEARQSQENEPTEEDMKDAEQAIREEELWMRGEEHLYRKEIVDQHDLEEASHSPEHESNEEDMEDLGSGGIPEGWEADLDPDF